MGARIITLCLLSFACLAHSFGQDLKPECPSIDVVGPAGIVQPGEKVRFTGLLRGNVPKNVSYQWEVSHGIIVEGKGTLEILVEVDEKDLSRTLTATLTVSGLSEGCTKSFSLSFSIGCILPTPVLSDEFGSRLAKKDIEARLNKFHSELANNPNSQGYIINYGTDKEIAVRERLIVNSINFREYIRARITLVRGGTHESGRVYTKLYRVPPGADNPTP